MKNRVRALPRFIQFASPAFICYPLSAIFHQPPRSMIPSASYLERVYAGVLGKVIGVYLGRPFEGWPHHRIETELGEIWYYVHERLRVPLVVADDDISGTFTFLRALPDHGGTADLTSEQIGLTWLNYIVENRSILWWGGLGNSSEHTAFLRLKNGVPAPLSGAIQTNGKTVAEQIGAQIFIDGWALVSPGNPRLAVELARKAASVSHDGEAVFAAQFLAAMESQAFIDSRIDQLIETGLSFIPVDSLIARLINDVRIWCATDRNWRTTRERIEKTYGYDRFPGNCHVVPNHAIIILSLLYSEDDFRRALMIANTAGWDTDCNSGNVGCLMGIKNGLPAIDARLREPVADRLFLSTADGGRCITDAVRETYEICRIANQLGQVEPVPAPKRNARFHFELPGSVQGFQIDQDREACCALILSNVVDGSTSGQRSLALDFERVEEKHPVRIATATFIPPDSKVASDYSLMACPTLFSGQVVKGRLAAGRQNSAPIRVAPFVASYNGDDELTRHYGSPLTLLPGAAEDFQWKVEEIGGVPIARFGFEIRSDHLAKGRIHVDYVDWSGPPTTVFRRPESGGTMWRRAWINAIDHVGTQWASAFHLCQDRGTGLFIQGTRGWQDYTVQAAIMADPAKSFGLAARVQGLTRYYALMLGPKQALRLLRNYDSVELLEEVSFTWHWHQRYRFNLQVVGNVISGSVDGNELIRYHDPSTALRCGGIALVCEEGLIMTDEVSIAAVDDK
jgi:ADP-ribosylglycohydrolase